MTVRIPKSFSLMNRDYQVDHATDAEQSAMDDYEDGPVLGLCDPDANRVVLARHRSRESFEHTYFHELAHALFEAVGKPDLSADEALVDAIGAALHQYEKTKAGSLPVRRRKQSVNQTKTGSTVQGRAGDRGLVDRGRMVRRDRQRFPKP